MTEPHLPPGEPLPPQFQFRLGGTLFLCPAAAVEAITSFEAPVPLPRVPTHVLGLVTFDQRALVLLDLARFLELPVEADEERPRIIVMSAGEYRVGLPVEAALGVVHLEASAVKHGTDVFTDRLAEFVIAEGATEAGLSAVLDLERLLEAARA